MTDAESGLRLLALVPGLLKSLRDGLTSCGVRSVCHQRIFQ